MAFDINSFDFATMKENLGSDPFAEKSKYETDDRFYKLEKDKDGNGLAVIAFLPDSESRPIQQLYKINATNTMNGKRRFVNEWSPANVGQPDPFQEMWQIYWNQGNKDEARKFSRITRFVTNIKVIKDPANPANNGKIFLYDMSHTMKEAIMKALSPSEQELALGEKPKEIFNPLKGWVFYLKCSKGANGIPNYDRSEFKYLGDGKTIYGALNDPETLKKFEDDIVNKTYKLSSFLIPSGQPGSVYKTYDELKAKLDYVMFKNAENTVTEVAEAKPSQPEIKSAQEVNAQPQVQQVQEVQEIQTPQITNPDTTPSSSDSLDDILAGL